MATRRTIIALLFALAPPAALSATTSMNDAVTANYGGSVTATCGLAVNFEYDKEAAFDRATASGLKVIRYFRGEIIDTMAELFDSQFLWTLRGPDWTEVALERGGRFCILNSKWRSSDFDAILKTPQNVAAELSRLAKIAKDPGAKCICDYRFCADNHDVVVLHGVRNVYQDDNAANAYGDLPIWRACQDEAALRGYPNLIRGAFNDFSTPGRSFVDIGVARIVERYATVDTHVSLACTVDLATGIVKSVERLQPGLGR